MDETLQPLTLDDLTDDFLDIGSSEGRYQIPHPRSRLETGIMQGAHQFDVPHQVQPHKRVPVHNVSLNCNWTRILFSRPESNEKLSYLLNLNNKLLVYLN